jgi:hypothetical protein
MLMKSTRRQMGLALGVLALSMALPQFARAQQSGLFPNAPIRRQRVPCDHEDPVYKLYRYQYFGYHPTCWRRFPDGWGCPSPEAPDAAKSFREIPRSKPPEDMGFPGEEENLPGGEMEQPGLPGGERPAIPAVPEDTENPFQLDNGPKNPVPPPGDAPQARTNDLPRMNAPELAPTTESDGDGVGRTTWADATDEAQLAGLDRPLLEIPDANTNFPAAGNRNSARVAAPAEVAELDPALPASESGPGEARSTNGRRSLIGSLFGGMNWNRRRR